MAEGTVNCPAGGAWFEGGAELPGGAKVGAAAGLPCSDGCNRSVSACGAAVCAVLGAGASANSAMGAAAAKPNRTGPMTLRGRQRRGTMPPRPEAAILGAPRGRTPRERHHGPPDGRPLVNGLETDMVNERLIGVGGNTRPSPLTRK